MAEHDCEIDGVRQQPPSKKRKLEKKINIKLGELYYRLRSICPNWTIFGLHLLDDCSFSKIKAKVDARHLTVEEGLLEVLVEWKNKTDIPTCQAVIEALNAMDENELSSNFFELKDCVVEKMKKVPLEVHSANFKLIKEQFANLVFDVAERLEEMTVKVDKFRLYVTTLFQPGKIALNADSITNICASISEHQLWDYDSPAYVESIVKKFARTDSDLNRWVSDYESSLIGFKASIKIADFIEICRGDNFTESDDSIQSDMARYDRRYCCKLWLKLELDVPVTTRSLIYIDHLWKSISKRLAIEPLAVSLEKILSGCIEVTWYVPTLSALQIQAGCLPYNEFFREHKIAWMTCDKETLYKQEMSEEEFIAEQKKVRKKLEDNLISSAKEGDVLTLERLLLIEIDPNIKETDEESFCWTPLLWACKEGHGEVVDKLIEFRADVHAEDSEGWTGLILSSWSGCSSIVEKLLNSGADINKCTKNLWSALMWAAHKGHTKIAKLLLQRGAKMDTEDKNGFTPFLQACQQGNVEVVKLLAEHDEELDMDQKSKASWSAIMLAVKNGHEELVRYLVQQGCDVQYQREEDLITALHIASYKGYNNIVRYLCLSVEGKKERLEANVKDCTGVTPLMYAAKKGHLDVVKTLVTNGHAKVQDTEEDSEWTALFFAVEGRHNKVVEYLLTLTKEADMCHEDKFKYTVVDFALEMNREAHRLFLNRHRVQTEKLEKQSAGKPKIDMNNYTRMLRRIDHERIGKDPIRKEVAVA